ncbi:MAG: glycosyltransferase family 39 protein [bacterium]
MKKTKLSILVFFLFSCIVFIAFITRIYLVDRAPSGILIDEASFGYNAYSILKTGKDEHGVSFPMVFKAFGDQKLPAYAYASVPFIKLLGLNNLAVRFPSVLAGTALAGIVFLLLIEIGFSIPISFIGGLVTATSPWSIIISRFGFESNFGLMFFMLGYFFIFKSYKKNSIVFAVLAGFCLGITLYSYVAFKLITPVILVGLLGIQYFTKSNKNKIWAIVFVTFLISIIPILITVFSSQTTARFTQIGLNYNTGLKMEIDENRAFCGTKLPKLLCYASSNKPLFYLRTYLHRYITGLSPSYLFLDGDVEYKYLNVDHFGSFYVWLLPFYFFGFAYLWKKIKARSLTLQEKLLILGLLISPLPTLLVSGPQKVRISALFPFISLVIMYGITQVEGMMKKSWHKYIFYTTLIIVSLMSVGFFLIQFLTVQVNKYETAYGTYIPKLMRYLGQQDKNTQIYIRSIAEGIMYYAYFNAIDPIVYQQKVIFKEPDIIGFAHAKDLENIHITEESALGVACRAKIRRERALFVSNENDKNIPDSTKKIIYSENGVDTLAIIYDLSKMNDESLNCNLSK